MAHYITDKKDNLLEIKFDWSNDLWTLFLVGIFFLLAMFTDQKLVQFTIILFLFYSLIQKTIQIEKGEKVVIRYSIFKVPLIHKEIILKKRLKYYVRKEKRTVPIKIIVGVGIGFRITIRSRPEYELVLHVEGQKENIIQRGVIKRDLETFFSLTNKYIKNRD